MVEVVVFDMDGTLLSKDSTKVWLINMLRSNALRFIAAIFVIPIAMPLMKIKKYKYLGASLFLWVATYGLNEKQIEESFKEFANRVKENAIHDLYWFKDGISELETHLNENRHVIIATAAPERLAIALFNSIGLNVHVVGTPLKKNMGGWMSGIHCRYSEKVRRLQLIGIHPQWFATYSDDIEEDYPILVNSKYPYLINANKPKIVCKELDHIHELKWK